MGKRRLLQLRRNMVKTALLKTDQNIKNLVDILRNDIYTKYKRHDSKAIQELNSIKNRIILGRRIYDRS